MITKMVLMTVLDLYPISLYVVPLPASQLTATTFISTALVQIVPFPLVTSLLMSITKPEHVPVSSGFQSQKNTRVS